jgi:hypothetical protein
MIGKTMQQGVCLLTGTKKKARRHWLGLVKILGKKAGA